VAVMVAAATVLMTALGADGVGVAVSVMRGASSAWSASRVLDSTLPG
jgi:hypothetical protein